MSEGATEQAEATVPRPERGALAEVAEVFFRLGCTSFGGPAAHIAMMRQEIVQRRRWLSDARFLDLLGVVNLIPGPNSTQLALSLGLMRGGWAGLLVAGVCFIGPAMLIVLALAWAYVAFGALPAAQWLFYGIKPVVIAILLYALWGLGRSVLRGAPPIICCIGLFALYLLGVNELPLLVGGALAFWLIGALKRRRTPQSMARQTTLALAAPTGLALIRALPRLAVLALTVVVPVTLLTLFLTFLKIGAVLYGSGYVLLAFLRTEFVQHLGWLTERQLLDAVAIGQFTPGPVFTTATFVGYLVAGWPGALLATLGIFLPSFLFVPLVQRLATWLRSIPWLASALAGVSVAALALMAGVTLQLGQQALVDVVTWLIAGGALLTLARLRLNSAWLILAGAVVGVLAHVLAR